MATPEEERIRQLIGGGTGVPAGGGLSGAFQALQNFLGGGVEQQPSGESPQQGAIPEQLINQIIELGFTEDDLRQFLFDEFGNPLPFPDIERLQKFIATEIRTRKLTAPQDQRREARSLEELMTQAILDDNFELATSVRRFRDNPSDLESLNAALSLATSPADIGTLSAIARGVFPRQAPGPGEVRSLPLSPVLQRAGENLFGIEETPFQPESQFPTSLPEGLLPTPQPVPQTVQRREGAGPIPFGSIQGTDPNALNIGLRNAPSLTPQLQVQPQQEPIPRPVSAIDPNQILNINATDILNQSNRFPSPSGFERVEPIPEVQRFEPPTPTLADKARFVPQPSQGNPLIPEGTPVSRVNFDGEEREIPVGIGQLFAGIKGDTTIQRPQSGLGAVGLPLPSAQGFSRLTAAEQDEFFKLAASQGLDLRDVQRELRSTQPGGLPRPRIRSAAGR